MVLVVLCCSCIQDAIDVAEPGAKRLAAIKQDAETRLNDVKWACAAVAGPGRSKREEKQTKKSDEKKDCHGARLAPCNGSPHDRPCQSV